MQIEILHSTGSDKLILIAAGWGSGPACYAHISMPGWDTAVIYGIDSLTVDTSVLSSYKTIYLYAWSLGVYVAERELASKIEFTRAYAINGTPWPCDDSLGIPAAIFTNTASGLSERNLHKFRVRMCGSLSAYRPIQDIYEQVSDIEQLRSQLQHVIANPIPHSSPAIRWDKAFVGQDDMIFPSDNQKNAWTPHTDVVMLSEPHYIDIATIVKGTIIDSSRVGKRFTRSLSTYDAHAHAQRLIAERLADMAFGPDSKQLERVIEIGPGTGIFTRLWSQHFRAQEATFVDVCQMPLYGVAEHEKYLQQDAERVVSEMAISMPDSTNAIFSTSVIQWFNNLQDFFCNCYRLLHTGGMMVLSTFAPGNLYQLHQLRPDHIRYYSDRAIKEMLLCAGFANPQTYSEDIELEFSTPLEALKHLQLTGVTTTGSNKTNISDLKRFAAHFPMNDRGRYPLTFKPIYILAQK